MPENMTRLPSYIDLQAWPELWPAVEALVARLERIEKAAKCLCNESPMIVAKDKPDACVFCYGENGEHREHCSFAELRAACWPEKEINDEEEV